MYNVAGTAAKAAVPFLRLDLRAFFCTASSCTKERSML